MSYTLLSSFAYMDVAPEGEHGCNFFHIVEERVQYGTKLVGETPSLKVTEVASSF